VVHNNHDGVWYLDPVLRLWYDAPNAAPLSGRMVRVEQRFPEPFVRATYFARPPTSSLTADEGGDGANEKTDESSDEYGDESADNVDVLTTATASFLMEGDLWHEGDTQTVRHLVEGRLSSTNNNLFVDPRDGWSISYGEARGEVNRTSTLIDAAGHPGLSLRSATSQYTYPFNFSSRYTQLNDTHYTLRGIVSMASRRREGWTDLDGTPQNVDWCVAPCVVMLTPHVVMLAPRVVTVALAPCVALRLANSACACGLVGMVHAHMDHMQYMLCSYTHTLVVCLWVCAGK